MLIKKSNKITNKISLLFLYPVCALAAIVALIWLPIAIIIGSDRALPIMLTLDRLANAVFGGSARETISSRAYRGTNEDVKGWCILCKFLDFIQKDHCKLSEGK